MKMIWGLGKPAAILGGIVVLAVSVFVVPGDKWLSGDAGRRAGEAKRAAQKSARATRSWSLLAEPDIQAELELTPEQKSSIDSLARRFDKQAAELRDAEVSSGLSRREEILELRRQVLKEAETVLSPAQLMRFKQINWQLMGISVFSDADFLERLEITGKQLAHAHEVRAKLRATSPTRSGDGTGRGSSGSGHSVGPSGGSAN